MRYLIIVESPSKCKKIQNYLQQNFPNHSFIVAASVGHFMELSKKKMGIDINNNFKPNWVECKDKKKVITNLKSLSKKVDKIIIASDLDAEGEKIAYDVVNLLKLDLNDNNRIIFNEITSKSIKNAFENPTKVNMNLVHSQFARRILDRLIGFQISPITAKQIQRGVSAGRVLSITTKIVYEKEQEILSREKNTFFQIFGDFYHKNYILNNTTFEKHFKTEQEVIKILSKFTQCTFNISNIIIKNKKTSPPFPFITSTINQSSPYSIRQTTGILQKLYQKGLITYIRTDSTKMADTAKHMIKEFITKKYNENMFQYRKFNFKKVKGAQEAHECIRPTDINKSYQEITNLQEKKIYEIIWKRTLACLMKDSQYISKDIEIKPSKTDILFTKNLNKYTFLGWKILYTTLKELNKDVINIFDKININDELKYIEIKSVQKYNSLKGRYTEPSLVKKLEKLGIGRPSTYSTAVSNIQTKLYVKKDNIPGEKVKSSLITLKSNKIIKKYFEEIINAEKNKLIVTNLGKKVTEFLDEDFDTIMNYNFTSDIEDDLDKIQNNEIEWYKVIKKYYDQFYPQVEKSKKNIKKKSNVNNLIGEYNNKKFYRFNSQWGPRIKVIEENCKDLYLTPINNVLLSEIKLNECLQLLPRVVGNYENYDIELHYSKNLYIKWNSKNVPLHFSFKNVKKEDLNLRQCIYCIDEFKKKKLKKSKKTKKKK